MLEQVQQRVPGGPLFIYVDLSGAIINYDPRCPVIPVARLACVLCRFEVNATEPPELQQRQ